MEARQLNSDKLDPRVEEALARTRQLGLPAHYVYWIDQAELYAKQHAVNPTILESIAQQLAWQARFEAQPIYQTTKRIFDFAVAVALLLLLTPLLFLVSLAIFATSPGPVLFTQLRIGQFCRPFKIYKFRTLVVGSPRVVSFLGIASREQRASQPHRVTKIGMFLRRWSVDETPQLINVLRGEMSLVGPRPLTPCDSSVTPPQHAIRFAVRPGLTGMWQARASTTNLGMEKLRMDAEYAASSCWRLDLSLLASTGKGVIARTK